MPPYDVVAFLMDMLIACRFRTNPAILKGITSIHSQLLPVLTGLENTSLQSCIDVVKSQCAKVDIFNHQTSTRSEVLAHCGKRLHRVRKILADICAKYYIHRTK